MVGIRLKCRNCSSEFEAGKLPVCPECFGPLDVTRNLDEVPERGTIESRPRSMWRYFELLPVSDKGFIVDMGTGYTPLIRCRNLGRELGLRELYIKNETVNPTHSFKDRPAEVAISKARELGDRVVGCSSTGNLGASLAAHAALARMPCYIIAPADIEEEKVAQIVSYGARIIGIEGTYDDASRLSILASELLGWNMVNYTIRPYYSEGSKTMAYEIAEQLGWELPDHVIIPVGSGSLLYSAYKAFRELIGLGWVKEKVVRISGAQGAGCAPVARAFEMGMDHVEPVKSPRTIAESIAIGDPGDGEYALKAVRETGGVVYGVSDDEIRDSIRLLARTEGVFAEPTGGVVIGVLRRMVEEGKIDRDERVICYITGSGLKTVDVVGVYVKDSLIRIKPYMEELITAVEGGG